MPSRPTPELLDSLRKSKQDLHASQRELPLPEKIRQVLALQRIDYAVRSARGELRSWETPWEIEP
ncbi:MAG: hypothetical protein AABO58_01300 [Acidobacteriota bacterium]